MLVEIVVLGIGNGPNIDHHRLKKPLYRLGDACFVAVGRHGHV